MQHRTTISTWTHEECNTTVSVKEPMPVAVHGSVAAVHDRVHTVRAPGCLALPAPCRSLGDLTAATVGCTSDPEVTFTTLRPHTDQVLVMATDGVWDVLTNEQVRCWAQGSNVSHTQAGG